MAHISNLACKEHVVGGQCTCNFFSLICGIFHENTQNHFCIDVNSHLLTGCNPTAVLRTPVTSSRLTFWE